MQVSITVYLGFFVFDTYDVLPSKISVFGSTGVPHKLQLEGSYSILAIPSMLGMFELQMM